MSSGTVNISARVLCEHTFFNSFVIYPQINGLCGGVMCLSVSWPDCSLILGPRSNQLTNTRIIVHNIIMSTDCGTFSAAVGL